MTSKLGLNPALIAEARSLASDIVAPVQEYIDAHTTVSVERTVLRLLGVDGVNALQVPWPNTIVDNIQAGGGLGRGAAYWYGNALLSLKCDSKELFRRIEADGLQLTEVPAAGDAAVRAFVEAAVKKALDRIDDNRRTRDRMRRELGMGPPPLLYIIVASGNIFEDVIQARSAVAMGADIIAVIRSTAQSLMDYVPYGTTTEGYGGTYATQANFAVMRGALDEEARKVGRYIGLTNYSSGLCMAEIAAMAALERLDYLLNDSMYGILFRDINMKRTFIDQHFSRRIISRAGICIQTGEDNYLTTSDAVEQAHTVLTSQLINEQFGLRAGLPPQQMCLGHAFEMNPEIPDGFLMELAQAQMIREIFPEAPIKYMPPTKHKTGNIFMGHLLDAMFSLCSVMSDQSIHLVGLLTEALHTPFMHDRYLSLENARYIFNNARHLASDIDFKPGGVMQARARAVLAESVAQLKEIRTAGLMEAIHHKAFADIARDPDGSKGLEGVLPKGADYWNPIMDLLCPKIAEAAR